MKFIQRLINSFNYAITGIIKVLKSELNMKIHFIFAILALSSGVLFNLSKVEVLILFLTITLVIFAEMINTAIEELSDLVCQEFNQQIKLIKDIAAGAVLITALNALIVGYVIFFRNFKPVTLDLLYQIHQTPIHLTFVALVVVLLIIIAVKSRFNKGTPLQGGMPSGHSAIAFCLMIIISILANNALVATLALLLALLVAQSRVEGQIHSFWEVVCGAVIGLIVGILIFQLL
ncbi:diacylglycerol kinase [Natroniella sulfidigena]|uniref:diacylglycerol kinase n=1 Tax=Natroniella sulfidigena TaxID=723921 RepID=UPI0024A6F9E3|nr:diacylglycerol kinase [Natroniella sulfidigena]MCK8815930.1 diacylglycerol kinase [Natroniella sulfidigena]